MLYYYLQENNFGIGSFLPIREPELDLIEEDDYGYKDRQLTILHSMMSKK